MAIKVLLADDHLLLRQGIKRILSYEEDIEIVGEAGDGQEALARTLGLHPDVLLLDLNMPVLNGIEVARQLRAAKSPTKIIVLTIHEGSDYVLEVLNAGAAGYLLKDVEPGMFLQAIRMVARGNMFVDPKLAERIFGGACENADLKERAAELWQDTRALHLTGREMEVIACIARGCSNRDIAQALFVSEKTVKNHLTSIFRKLHVNDRTQALIYVLRHKLMTLDGSDTEIS